MKQQSIVLIDLILILMFIISFSCSEQIEEIKKVKEIKLIKIESNADGNMWIENYFYNLDGVLCQVVNSESYRGRYEIQYLNKKLTEYSMFRIADGKKLFRDSVAYDSLGRIQKIFNYSINSGTELPLTWIYEYEYDHLGKLSKRSFYSKIAEVYFWYEKYFWNGSNIIRMEEYCESKEICYEYFYTYDNKVNYKANIPIYISDPLNWCENNVTSMNWYDYHGNLDIICRPCVTSYKYNLENYPIEIITNWGFRSILTYK
jgi:hypothetical protein